MPFDYTLSGIGPSVEYGKGGNRVRDTGGAFLQVVDNAGAAFARMQGATPSAPDDFTTKFYVDGLIGTPTWATVLATGANSGANDPIIDDGRAIIGGDAAGANAGGYTVRAGNHTAGTGSFAGGALLIQGGNNVSTSNGAAGGALTAAGGDNLVATGATGGKGLFRGGTGGIGGECEVAGGEGIAANSGGALTCHGGDNTATGKGGNATYRGGDCVSGSGNDAGGSCTIRGGNARGSGTSGDMVVQGGQPGGVANGRTGRVFINTDSLSGTNRQTGEIQVLTGDSNSTSNITGSGDLTLGSGAATVSGFSGDVFLRSGTAADGITGDVTIGSGNTGSNDTNERTGKVSIVTGNRTSTTSSAGSGTGDIDIACGTSANPNATGGGGTARLKGGNNSNTGLAGDATVEAGFASGGTGKVKLIAQSAGTSDAAHVSTDTQSGSFAGSDHRIVTKGLAISGGTGASTAVAIQGPTVDGQNVKIKVWATAVDTSNPADQLGHLIEQVFIRNLATTTAMTAHVNNVQGTGSWPPTVFVTLTPSGSQILVEANALTTNASRWMFWVEWQIGGMAA